MGFFSKTHFLLHHFYTIPACTFIALYNISYTRRFVEAQYLLGFVGSHGVAKTYEARPSDYNPLGSTLIPTAGRLSRLRIWPTANISMWYRCTEWTLRRYGRKCSRTDRLTIQASPQGQPILRGCLFIILRSIVTLYRASIPALCHHPLCNKMQAWSRKTKKPEEKATR